ncbi:MAG: GNAT family N-acetyltransferase [Haloferacaceae archaeon]
MFPETIETDRLELERYCRENVSVHEAYEVCSAPEMDEVTRYVTWDPYETPKDAADFLDAAEAAWEDGRGATYAVRVKADGGAWAGNTGLSCDWERDAGALGLWLRKRYWGRGYSGERAAALLELAFETLDLSLVEVTHHADNENSERAVEKYVDRFGGRREGTLRGLHPGDEGAIDAVRYTVTAGEYRAATR